MTNQDKSKTVEFRDYCSLREPECEFCGERNEHTVHLYVCRETGTGNYRDYPILAHPGCFLAFVKAEFDEYHQNREL